MLSLNTRAIMSLLSSEQMVELYHELQKEISKNSYDGAAIKIPQHMSYFDSNTKLKDYPKQIVIGFEYIPDTNEWYLSNSMEIYYDDIDNNMDYVETVVELLSNFKRDDNIPIGIIKSIYSPKMINYFIKHDINIVSIQTKNAHNMYPYFMDDNLTPIDLTFQSKMFIHTTDKYME